LRKEATIPDQQIATGFEEIYCGLRAREGRIYADEEVRQLPRVKEADPNRNEWAVRERSAKRLFHYLSSRRRSLKILEVGCGNGWL
jgi:hypothetical protein